MWVYLLYKVGIFLSCHLPSFLAYWIAKRLAGLCFLVSIGRPRLYKKAIFYNLSLILSKNERNPGVRQTARCSYYNFSRYLREFFWLPGLDRKKFLSLITPVGVENLDYALSKGKGAILLSIHFGNWEWGGIGIALSGYKVNFLVRKHQNKWTNKLFCRIREEMGVKVFFLEELRKAIKALKKNEILAVLADEDVGESVEVDFFKHKVGIPSGPFKLARRTGAMIAPVFTIRDRKDNRQRGIIERPFKVRKTCDEEESIREAANRFIQLVQDYLYYYPDHWLLGKPKIVARRSSLVARIS